MKKRLLYVFLVSLFCPFLNENIWETSGVEFWTVYGIIFAIAFLFLTMMFVIPLKEDFKKEDNIKSTENE